MLAQIGKLGNQSELHKFDLSGRISNASPSHQTGFHKRKRKDRRSAFDFQ
jgi:hypothetical protein